jgi:hypothetical protein
MDLCWFSLGDDASYLMVLTGRQRICLSGVAFKLEEVRTAVSAPVWCMSSLSDARKSPFKKLTANDERFALAA